MTHNLENSNTTDSESESNENQILESSEKVTSSEEEEISIINMATEAEVVHLDAEEDGEGETSNASRTQRTTFPKSKGVQTFTIDDIPSEKWEEDFRIFMPG